jgi:hypothetical protein
MHSIRLVSAPFGPAATPRPSAWRNAAIDDAVGLDAMTDDPAATMAARRSERLNGALEAVEGHARSPPMIWKALS